MNHEDKFKLNLVEQELSVVRVALAKAEAEMNNSKLQTPKVLQQWLQMTYKKEAKFFHYKKQQALTQMTDAKDAVIICKITTREGKFKTTTPCFT